MLLALWWWLVAQVVAACALPLCLVLFRPLADRGYGLSKAFGLLLFGYVAWLLVASRLLANGLPALGLTLLLVAAGSALVWRREGASLLAFWHRRRGLLLLEEGVFLSAYLGFLAVRSYTPEISGTEKFMDFAFMNAVTRSTSFPPLDPWLAPSVALPHPTINYYYFGYLIQGLLLQLANAVPGAVPPATAFNLALGLLFGLTATGSFGLAYGLARDLIAEGAVAVRRRPPVMSPPLSGGASASPDDPPPPASIPVSATLHPASPARSGATPRPRGGAVWSFKAAGPYVAAGLLAVYLLLIAGNLWTALRLVDGSGMWDKDFWQGIGWNATRVLVIKEAAPSGAVAPDGARDVDYTINEFPSFSFLLGDLHPHVLSLPFVLVAVGLAYRWLLAPPGLYRWALTDALPADSPPVAPPPGWPAEHRRPVTRLPGRAAGARRTMRTLRGGPVVRPAAELLPGAMVLGSLYFLNSWDFPAYFLLAQAAALGGARRAGRSAAGWPGRSAIAVALVGALSLAAVAPFLLTFRPPIVADGGGLPLGLVAQRSLLGHFLQFWGAQLLLLAPPLLVALATSLGDVSRPAPVTPRGEQVAPDGLSASGLSAGRLSAGRALAFLAVGTVALILLAETFQGGTLLLGLALAGCAGWVTWRALTPGGESACAPAGGPSGVPRNGHSASGRSLNGLSVGGGRPLAFAFGAICLAALLLVTCEVVYIQDIYGGAMRRMNTVFKLYYQAWLLIAIGGSATTFWLLHRLWQRRLASQVEAGLLAATAPPATPAGSRRPGRLAWPAAMAGCALLLLAMALYPSKATLLRTERFQGPATLNGMDWLRQAQPEDYAAAEWLRRYGADSPPTAPDSTAAPSPADGDIGGRRTLREGPAPVVLEATGGPYSEFARMATQTGFPTVLGWDQHERLWRGAAIEQEITARQRDVDAIYSAATLGEIQPLLDKYVVAYVVVGYLERQKYGPSGGLAKFDAGGPGSPEAVFRQGRTAVYRTSRGDSTDPRRADPRRAGTPGTTAGAGATAGVVGTRSAP